MKEFFQVLVFLAVISCVASQIVAQEVPSRYHFLEVIDFNGTPVQGAEIYPGFRKNPQNSGTGFLTDSYGMHKRGLQIRYGSRGYFYVQKNGFHEFFDVFGLFGSHRLGRKDSPVKIMLLRKKEPSDKERREQLKREIFVSAKRGELNRVRQLLRLGVPADLMSGDLVGIPVVKSSPLINFGAQSGNSALVVMLLDAGAPSDTKTNTHALLTLLESGSILEEQPYTQRINSNSLRRFEEGAMRLIEAGIDNTSTGLYDQDAVMISAEKGYLLILKRLLADGADPNVVNRRGVNSLFYAIAGNAKPDLKIAIIKELVAKGADVNKSLAPATICNFAYPLVHAALRGEVELTELLLSFGANPNISCRGKTILEMLKRQYFANKQIKSRVKALLISTGANSH